MGDALGRRAADWWVGLGLTAHGSAGLRPAARFWDSEVFLVFGSNLILSFSRRVRIRALCVRLSWNLAHLPKDKIARTIVQCRATHYCTVRNGALRATNTVRSIIFTFSITKPPPVHAGYSPTRWRKYEISSTPALVTSWRLSRASSLKAGSAWFGSSAPTSYFDRTS